MAKFIDKIKSIFKKEETTQPVVEEKEDENPYAKYSEKELIEMRDGLYKDLNVYYEMNENRSRNWETFSEGASKSARDSAMFAFTILSDNINIIQGQISHIEKELARRKAEASKIENTENSVEAERE